MVSPVDLLILWEMSPPAILVAIAILLWVQRQDLQDIDDQVDKTHRLAKSNSHQLDRHELLLDNLAEETDNAESARQRNDHRLRRLEEKFSVRQGDAGDDPSPDGGYPVPFVYKSVMIRENDPGNQLGSDNGPPPSGSSESPDLPRVLSPDPQMNKLEGNHG